MLKVRQPPWSVSQDIESSGLPDHCLCITSHSCPESFDDRRFQETPTSDERSLRLCSQEVINTIKELVKTLINEMTAEIKQSPDSKDANLRKETMTHREGDQSRGCSIDLTQVLTCNQNKIQPQKGLKHFCRWEWPKPGNAVTGWAIVTEHSKTNHKQNMNGTIRQRSEASKEERIETNTTYPIYLYISNKFEVLQDSSESGNQYVTKSLKI